MSSCTMTTSQMTLSNVPTLVQSLALFFSHESDLKMFNDSFFFGRFFLVDTWTGYPFWVRKKKRTRKKDRQKEVTLTKCLPKMTTFVGA